MEPVTTAAVSHCEILIHSSEYTASPLNGILPQCLHTKASPFSMFLFFSVLWLYLLLVIFPSLTLTTSLTQLWNNTHLLVLPSGRRTICITLYAPQPHAHAAFSHLLGMDCYLQNRLGTLWCSTQQYLKAHLSQHCIRTMTFAFIHFRHRWKGASRWNCVKQWQVQLYNPYYFMLHT